MLIRLATDQDLPAMLDIYNDIIANTTAVWHYEPHTLQMRTEWFEQRQQQGFPIFVAEEAGKVLGFSTFGSFRPWPGYSKTVENSVYVAADSRGKGVANLLLPPLIEAARQLGIHAIVAGIDAENEISIALHKKFGFVEVAHFKEVGWKFGRWLDLKFLELVLASPNPSKGGA
ncbi:MAG TPA: N-acetyltransferase family protein [Ferruginibacter sp.]|nr:N-acetyltransferase family protein [Ferruginibacter sp.]